MPPVQCARPHRQVPGLPGPVAGEEAGGRPGWHAAGVRMSEFWTLVDDQFGSAQGRALVRDHIVGTLAHRTAEQAIAAGEDPRDVWFALCDDLQVPADQRWGRDERGRSKPTRRR